MIVYADLTGSFSFIPRAQYRDSHELISCIFFEFYFAFDILTR